MRGGVRARWGRFRRNTRAGAPLSFTGRLIAAVAVVGVTVFGAAVLAALFQGRIGSSSPRSVAVTHPAPPRPLHPAVVRPHAAYPTETTEPASFPPPPVAAAPAPAPTPVPLPTRWVWKDHAVPPATSINGPVLAILLDDMGDVDDDTHQLKPPTVEAVETLPPMVSFAFFPWYAVGVAQARAAHAKGHEIWVHMPMEPRAHGTATFNPGLNALTVGMRPSSLRQLVALNMAPLASIAVGFNNHMGSRFTAWESGMRTVLVEAQTRGYAFVDSRTTGHTAVAAAARGLALPVLQRDVFLDDTPTPAAIEAQLAKAVALARKQGHALAIGHPLPETLAVLSAQLPALAGQGVVLVPVSALIALRQASSSRP